MDNVFERGKFEWQTDHVTHKRDHDYQLIQVETKDKERRHTQSETGQGGKQ